MSRVSSSGKIFIIYLDCCILLALLSVCNVIEGFVATVLHGVKIPTLRRFELVCVVLGNEMEHRALQFLFNFLNITDLEVSLHLTTPFCLQCTQSKITLPCKERERERERERVYKKLSLIHI